MFGMRKKYPLSNTASQAWIVTASFLHNLELMANNCLPGMTFYRQSILVQQYSLLLASPGISHSFA